MSGSTSDTIKVTGSGLGPNIGIEVDGHTASGPAINVGVTTTDQNGNFSITDTTAPNVTYTSLTLVNPATQQVILNVAQTPTSTGFQGSVSPPNVSDTITVNTPTPTPPTVAQLKQVVTDTLKFYADQVAGKSTASDLTTLTNDVKGLNLTQATLGQVLTTALQNDAGSNAGALANDLAGQYIGKIDSDVASGSSALPHDLASLVGETALVGATYHILASHESATTAFNQTVALFKLG